MPTLEEILKNSQDSDNLVTDNSFKSQYVAENISASFDSNNIPEFKTPRIQSISHGNTKNYEPLRITGESKKVRDVVIKSIEGENSEIPDFNYYKISGSTSKVPDFNATRITGQEFDPENLSTVDMAMILSANSPELIDTSLGLMLGKDSSIDPTKANVKSNGYDKRTGIVSAMTTEWENLNNGWESLKTDFGNLGPAIGNALIGSTTNAIKRITSIANNAMYKADDLINSVQSKITSLFNTAVYGNKIPWGVADMEITAATDTLSLNLMRYTSRANEFINNAYTSANNFVSNLLNTSLNLRDVTKTSEIKPKDLLKTKNILWHLSLASWDSVSQYRLYLNTKNSKDDGFESATGKTAAGTEGINNDEMYYIGPALHGYLDIEDTHPRVDNFYDFKLVAPQVNVNRGLPIPWRIREVPPPERVESFLNDYNNYHNQSDDFKNRYNNKNMLLLSNMAEISTVELSNGEQISLGDWGAVSIVKRLDQIARITTVIYEDRQHSVRKWLEAYKYYMYGAQPNPNIHKPIFQCWYRLQYYLLNNNRSVAYSRGFRVLPNFNLNMTPSDDIKEFTINWDVIGEELLMDTDFTKYNSEVLNIPWFQQLDRQKDPEQKSLNLESNESITYVG